MVNEIVFVLVLQFVFFACFYKFSLKLAPLIGRRVCPVCFAVGSTWLTLLLLNYFGLYSPNKFLIAILLAQSIVGVSYLVEEFTLRHKSRVPDYILKFGIIIYGTAAVSLYPFVNEYIGLALFVPVILFGFFALTPAGKNKTISNKASLELKDKLKSCC